MITMYVTYAGDAQTPFNRIRLARAAGDGGMV